VARKRERGGRVLPPPFAGKNDAACMAARPDPARRPATAMR